MATIKQRLMWRELVARADAAGQAAGEAAMPVPMTVVERADPLDDTSPVTRRYAPVMDGVCGFAWVTLRPGTTAFARWLVKEMGWRTAYGGGIQRSVALYNQSMTRKEAYANAFAEVLREAGYKAYANSRMD